MIKLLWFFCLFFNPAVINAEILVIIDDEQIPVHFSKLPNKIISLAPNITELVYSAGGGDKLIATVESGDFPPQAKTLRRIGGYGGFNLELIKALKPDLIIYWSDGTPEKKVAELKKLKLKLFALNPKTLNDIGGSIKKLGKILGTEPQALAVAESFDKQLNSLKPQIYKRPKVFIQIWHKPFITLNKDNIFNDIVKFCGGINIFAETIVTAPAVGLETILAANPDIILISHENHMGFWSKYRFVSAVKNKRIFYINPDFTNRATLRTINAVRKVCAHIVNF